jgi:hypothetical protein
MLQHGKQMLLCGVVMLMLSIQALLPTQAQSTILLQTDPAVAGYFRPNTWTPLRITVTNEGASVTGSLVVSAESSGVVVSNTYSTPIDMPSGTTKTTFLYVQLRDFTREFNVEFVTDAGERLAQESVGVTSIGIREKLYILVSDGTLSIPFREVRPVGENAFQAQWRTENLPDNPFALEAVDAIFLNNITDGNLTSAQYNALQAWVFRGGHLVLMGGANWQGVNTMSGELSGFQPTGTQTVTEFNSLERYLNELDVTLTGQAVITTGILTEDAQVLVQEGDLPLVVRRNAGDGVVDYLTFDPTNTPFRTWERLPAFWIQLIGSVPLPNSWGRGLIDTRTLSEAIAVLPTDNLLPPVETLIAFITIYIALIGPINYVVLSRMKRQEWAWFTIPLCILGFSLLASTVGFSLRGDEVVLSRLRVVQAWSNANVAIEHSAVGLLSPRRDIYSLSVPDNRLMNVVPGIGQSIQSVQSSVNLRQSTSNTAQNFPVDGGIFSNFELVNTITPPTINGQFTLVTNPDNTQTIQGSVRNDTDTTLEDVILLTRAGALQIGTLQPGQFLTIAGGQLILSDVENLSIPSQLESTWGLRSEGFTFGRGLNANFDEFMSANLAFIPNIQPDIVFQRQSQRRDLFLQTLMRDQFNSMALGDQVYMVAWTRTMPRDLTVEPANWRSVDDTLYLIEMDVTVEAPTHANQSISTDRLVWRIEERNLATEALAPEFQQQTTSGADDIILNPNDSVVVRFTPLPSARLETVDTLELFVVRSTGFSTQLVLEVWNWQTQTWVNQPIRAGNFVVEDAQAFVAPSDGSVRMRFAFDYDSGTLRLRNMRLTMGG